ncbi:MAG: heme NO-binding domain-containing protein [Alphaproteobacteria bacterium]
MKGIVFTELLDMVEDLFGSDMIDDILDDCELESGGAYTTVGTYDNEELFKIVGALSKKTEIPIKDLVYKYGHHLFFRFHALMPVFFEKPTSAFEFLESVHDTIHVEVKKLYPDATLPQFTTKSLGDNALVMVYKSQCPLADFAEGLMRGCIDFYKENIEIQSEDKNTEGEYSRIFTLVKK